MSISAGGIADGVHSATTAVVPCRSGLRKVLFSQTPPHEPRTVGNADTAAAPRRMAGWIDNATSRRRCNEPQTLRSLRDHAAAASRASERFTTAATASGSATGCNCDASHAS